MLGIIKEVSMTVFGQNEPLTEAEFDRLTEFLKDKAYTLKASDKERTELDKLAGKMATITGDVNGTTITVASVKMAAK